MLGKRGIAALAAVICAGALGACGGGERQDADEPEGTYKVDLVSSEFPLEQTLAQASELKIAVRNADSRDIPNVAITVDRFARQSSQAGLADPNRPVWIVDAGPKGGQTAYVGTWALGPLPAGATKTFVWRVTAVESGSHTVNFRVAAGLDGKAKAQSLDGSAPEGSFAVNISQAPAQARVDENGDVVREKQ